MPDWQDQYGQPQPVYQAELFTPDPPPSRTGRWVFFVLLSVLLFFLLAVATGISVFFYVVTSDKAAAETFEPETVTERTEALLAAYAGGEVDVGVPPEVLREFENVFRQVELAARSNDDAAFLKLVNLNLMFARAERIGAMPGVSVRVKSEVKLSSRELIGVDASWREITIRRIQLLGDGDGAVAYTYTEGDSNDFYQYRWWLGRKRGTWWICDWERVDLGMSEGAERAAYAVSWDALLLEDFWDACEHMRAAADLMDEGENDKAADRLQAAESLRVPQALEGMTKLLIGYYWRQCGKTQEALAAFRSIPDKAAIPGANLGMALCYDDLGLTRRTLEYATKYEQLVGVDVDSSRLRVDALESLGRIDQAAQACENILHIDPNDQQMLAKLAAYLPPDQAGRLIEYLDRSAAPADNAVNVAEAVADDGSVETLTAIADMLETRLGGGPRASYVQGLACRAAGNWIEAATILRQSIELETDESERNRYLYRYLDMMHTAGQALEAYRSLPDQELAGEAFEYYAEGYDYGESILGAEAVDELLAIHREAVPDDPWGHFYVAVRHREEQRFDAALEAIAQGMECTDDEDLLYEFRYERQLSLSEAGRIEEAYEQADVPEEAFEELADGCVWDERPADLRKLLAVHEANQPDDPTLDYYRAQACFLEGNDSQAMQLLQQGLANADPEDELLRDRYVDEILQRKTDLGEGLAAYQAATTDEERREVLEYLAPIYSRKQDWSSLQKLLSLHKLRWPDDDCVLIWEAELLWETGDLPQLLQQFTPWSAYRDRFEDEWRARSIPERLVRAYLRSGRVAEAAALAAELLETEGSILPSVLVSAPAGDVQGMLDHLADYDPIGYLAHNLYTDEDVGPALWSDAFQPVRTQFPPPWLLDSGRQEIVLLHRGSVAVDEQSLTDLVKAGAPSPVRTVRLPLDRTFRDRVTYVLTGGDVRICVTEEGSPYAGKSSVADAELKDEGLQHALQNHSAYVVITGVDAPPEHADAQAAVVRRLARNLAADCLAAYFPDESRLVGPGAELDDFLNTPASLSARPDWGEAIWLDSDEDAAEPEDADRMRQLSQARRELSSLFRSGQPDRPVEVRVPFAVGRAAEMVWLRAERMDRRRYGIVRYVCRWQDDSMLDPRFCRGQPISVYDYEIEAWRYAE